MNVQNPFVSEELDVCEVHVIAGCFNRSETDVTADDLNIKLRFDFLDLLYFLAEFLILLLLVDRPVLEWIVFLEIPHWLFKSVHQSFEEETS